MIKQIAAGEGIPSSSNSGSYPDVGGYKTGNEGTTPN